MREEEAGEKGGCRRGEGGEEGEAGLKNNNNTKKKKKVFSSSLARSLSLAYQPGAPDPEGGRTRQDRAEFGASAQAKGEVRVPRFGLRWAQIAIAIASASVYFMGRRQSRSLFIFLSPPFPFPSPSPPRLPPRPPSFALRARPPAHTAPLAAPAPPARPAPPLAAAAPSIQRPRPEAGPPPPPGRRSSSQQPQPRRMVATRRVGRPLPQRPRELGRDRSSSCGLRRSLEPAGRPSEGLGRGEPGWGGVTAPLVGHPVPTPSRRGHRFSGNRKRALLVARERG